MAPRKDTSGRRAPPKPPAVEYSHVDTAARYIEDVLSGRQMACRWVKLACQRHKDDLARAAGLWEYTFDPYKAERVCRFIEKLPHTKGKWAAKRELIKLEPFQCFIICVLFGWVRKDDGNRRFRIAYINLPRKNGKSALAAALGLYMLCADNETGAEVYSGATSAKQALEVFVPAKRMAELTPALCAHYGVQVNASNICIPGDGSKFEPIIGKPGDGSSPSFAIIDEYHEHDTSVSFDTMITGMGAREQPLIMVITTAGDNTAGPCYDLQLTVQGILDGVTPDDTIFGAIYTIDPGDDWTSPEAIRKANPNLGVSVKEDFLLAMQRAAIRNSREQGKFKIKHLCEWVGSRAGFFDLQKWAECANPSLTFEMMRGRSCYIGLDLASKTDIAAISLLFPPERPEGKWALFGVNYLPEDTVEQGENEHYRGWMLRDPPWINVTSGNIIDFQEIRDDLKHFAKMFKVESIGYDPYQGTMLASELAEEGLPVFEYRQTVANFSEPMKHLDGLIRSGKLEHQGDPCVTWMFGNCVAKVDAKDNVYPRKERPEKKIDGVVAAIMAIGRFISAEESDAQESLDEFYKNERDGFLFL